MRSLVFTRIATVTGMQRMSPRERRPLGPQFMMRRHKEANNLKAAMLDNRNRSFFTGCTPKSSHTLLVFNKKTTSVVYL